MGMQEEESEAMAALKALVDLYEVRRCGSGVSLVLPGTGTESTRRLREAWVKALAVLERNKMRGLRRPRRPILRDH